MLDRAAIDADLHRRQQGYGRSPRQQLEQDVVEVLAGLRHGRTLGTPLALVVRNRDHKNWEWGMNPWPPEGEPSGKGTKPVTLPRPGHADLAGVLKYDHDGRSRRARARQRAAYGGLRRGRRRRQGAPARARDRGRRLGARDRRRARELGGGDRRSPRRPGHARRDRRDPGDGRLPGPRLVRLARGPARRPARRGADGHPGREGRRGRRRLRARRASAARRPTTRSSPA